MAQRDACNLYGKCLECFGGVKVSNRNDKARVPTVGCAPAVDSHLHAAIHVDVIVVVEVGYEGIVIGTDLEADGIHRLHGEYALLAHELLLGSMVEVVCDTSVVADEGKLLLRILVVGSQAEIGIRLHHRATLGHSP